MRLAWGTDIHLDHARGPQRDELIGEIRASAADALLVGGDTASANSLGLQLRTLRQRTGLPVYFVLGNHDCYGSSIAATRALARRLHEEDPHLRWLNDAGVIPLTEKSALIGHDCWGDAGFGNPQSKVRLNDFLMIDELRPPKRELLLASLQALGSEAGTYLREVAADAATRFRSIITLVHVPPYREAAWHDGAVSNDEWLPFFACRAAGEALSDVMRAHPESRMTVLCGHTHGGGRIQPEANVEVITGAAEYGRPCIQKIIDVA